MTVGDRATCSRMNSPKDSLQSVGAGDASLENGSRGEEEMANSVDGAEDMINGRLNDRVGIGAATSGIPRAAKEGSSEDLGATSALGNKRLSVPFGNIPSSVNFVLVAWDDGAGPEDGGVKGAIICEPEPVEESDALGVMPNCSRSWSDCGRTQLSKVRADFGRCFPTISSRAAGLHSDASTHSWTRE